MKRILALVVVLSLVALTGLVGAADIKSVHCIGGHCDAAVETVVSDHAGHAHGSNAAHDEGCSTAHCHLLALTGQRTVHEVGIFRVIAGASDGLLSPLDQPDNPDRPPNT